LEAAKAAKNSAIVMGYCVGNEGLNGRYGMGGLSSAMQALRDATGKPVTTSEQFEHYSNADLARAGDWIFPTVHPYFHHVLEPNAAARWTVDAYAELSHKTDLFVLFKEVGLPTAGAPGENLCERNQDAYYAALAKTPVRFVYFEGFDQLWKTNPPVEPHWGIFRADRSPKALGQRLMATAR
jgi:exo-beta-1,3-glucanase (GH17 family)